MSLALTRGDDPTLITRGCVYKNMSASGLVDTGRGQLRGIFCASNAGGATLKIWNSLTATGAVLVNTFVPAAATFYNFGDADYNVGVYITLAVAAADWTVFYL